MFVAILVIVVVVQIVLVFVQKIVVAPLLDFLVVPV